MSGAVTAVVFTSEGKRTLKDHEYHSMPVSVRLEKLKSKELKFFRGKSEIPPREGIAALAEPIRKKLGM